MYLKQARWRKIASTTGFTAAAVIVKGVLGSIDCERRLKYFFVRSLIINYYPLLRTRILYTVEVLATQRIVLPFE